jgi:hypothetical protein
MDNLTKSWVAFCAHPPKEEKLAPQKEASFSSDPKKITGPTSSRCSSSKAEQRVIRNPALCRPADCDSHADFFNDAFDDLRAL